MRVQQDVVLLFASHKMCSVLTIQNQDVVAKAEKLLNDFKPVTYDIGAQVKAIDAFDAAAVRC